MVKIKQSQNENQTLAIASDFAKTLVPGDVVLLHGTLGAGKTVFVKGVVDALGGDTDSVASPTFTLVRRYDVAGKVIYHVDLYRLEKGEQESLALQELMNDPKGIVLIEWAEKLEQKVPGHVVKIRHLLDDSREISINRR